MKHITIIDTFAFFFRCYYAIPPLKNRDGFPTGVLTGFTNFINSLNELKSDYLVFALDSKTSNREKLYSEYKANRGETPNELKQQISLAIEWIEKMNLANISIDGFEADDVIASINKIAKEKGIETTIISSDKDLYQLLDSKTKMFDPIKKEVIDEAFCFKKFGVEPKDFITYQSLVGDSSDNVPGVKGIGAKTSERIVNEFKSLEVIYQNLSKLKPREAKLFNDSKQLAFISRELVTLKDNLFDELDFEQFRFEPNPLLKIEDELIKYELNSLLNRLKSEKKADKIAFKSILLDSKEALFSVIDSIPKDCIVAFDSESTSLDTKEATLVGFSFAFDEQKAFYVPMNHNYLGVGNQISFEDGKEAIERLLKFKIVGHNLKFDFSLVYNFFKIERVEIFADTMILAWLLSPDNSLSLDNLALRILNHQMIKYKDTVKKDENFSSVDIESAKEYASEDAYITRKLYFKLIDMLDSDILDESKMEFEFINILIDMENIGIKINIEHFERLLNNTSIELEQLSEEIYTEAGERFNINSTKQLGEILFNRLKLPTSKKTKSGFSTDESVLHSLEHNIAKKLLKYRELHKLKSTYFEPLLNYAKNNSKNRIYTSFIQTGTQTGRLSSKNPNLQNIPTKKEIRDGFIAKDGYKLIGIDYSQIELRLLAHFSLDSALIDAFNQNKDIHLETSKKIFGDKLAHERRPIAKSINFGLIYGMGAKKLSETLKMLGFEITQSEAKEYIDEYFKSFPSVKNYLSNLKDDIRNDGYVSTLLNRKRYFDFDSSESYKQEAYLREAVNTKFQGSAADIIKLSMIEIDKFLLNNQDVKILLQIHDELVFEAKESIADSIAVELQNIMQNIYKLNVSLKSDLKVGYSWGEVK